MTRRTERVVVLLRHGIADDRVEGAADDERPLTVEGQKKMKENARGLAELLPPVGMIVSSPLVRCVQTALFVGKACGIRDSIQTSSALRPDGTAEEVRALIDSCNVAVVILVGHEPSLTDAMTALTGLSGPLSLKKGGCYVLRQSSGQTHLESFLTPRVLRRVSA